MAAEQRGKTRSWLFGGWMSKNSEQESTHKNNPSSHGLTNKSSVRGETGGRASSPDYVDSNSPSIPLQRPRKKKVATFSVVEDDDHEDKKNEGQDHEVDKSAEDFIDKQKSKLEMERLISMKRYESMLNRGL